MRKPHKRSINNFWSNVDSPNEHGCLLWIGTTQEGYGRFSFMSKRTYSHRAAFYIFHNRWPEEGKVLAHLCEDFYSPGDMTSKRCVNIKHLIEVSQKENVRMAINNGHFALVPKFGIENVNVEITEDCVRWIRFFTEIGLSYRRIGKLMDIPKTTVFHVVSNRTWIGI